VSDGKSSTDGKSTAAGADGGAVAEKPDPVDHLVTTRHTLRTRRGEIA